MKQLTVKVDGSWVLSHRDDDELPLAALKTKLVAETEVEVKGMTLTSLVFVFDEKDASVTEMEEIVYRIFNERYPDESTVEKITFIIENAEEPEREEQDKEEAADNSDDGVDEDYIDRRRSELLDRLRHVFDDEDDDEEEEAPAPDGEKNAYARIGELVGVAEFKALAKELVCVAEEIKRTQAFDIFTHRCYLFSIGDGGGLTTYLGLFSKLISECGLAKMAHHAVREVRLGVYRESAEPFEEARRALERGGPESVRLVCVDISEWMDATENHYFKQFLRFVEEHAENNIVIFRVPFVEKDVLSRVKYSLSDLLSVKEVSFPPFKSDEIRRIAEAELERYHFTITPSAWRYFFDRMAEERSDGKFYGIKTVQKVVRELLYHKHLVNAERSAQSRQITVNDTRALAGGNGESELSGMEQLERLVGVEGIKKRVAEIVSQIEMTVKDGSAQRPCIHMRFVGNPGTGKTTVARIIGRILKDKGILRVGAFFEYAGRDFCGRYVGETAPKTASICRDAYGSVLFIDEAYSLYRGDQDSRDYGREAIDTLIAEMENHRSDFVVIMAGYTDDMEKLTEGNVGLKSRMPYTIEFPNFTREQLFDIFVSMTKARFKCEEELFDAARAFFSALPEETLSSKEFSNARYVRNLFERTWAKAAMRCQLGGKAEITLTRDDFEQASADKEFTAQISKKARLGF